MTLLRVDYWQSMPVKDHILVRFASDCSHNSMMIILSPLRGSVSRLEQGGVAPKVQAVKLQACRAASSY